MTAADVPAFRAGDDPPSGQLSRLEALADPELAELGGQELVEELLSRSQAALAADTVVLLLVDQGGSQLVARAARGLEDEVRQGFRMPVGRGFAGRVAATRTRVRLEEVGPNTVANPLLTRHGIRSLLGVPLIASGRLVGVLHVGSRARRHFSDDDASVLQLAADRIATAVDHEQASADRAAARTLQQSLLPTRLPEVDGLEFATRFVAAEDFGVGGDWYDAFRLPDDRIGIVIGDVAGSGLNAAVVMGRLRSALRAYAIETVSPGAALDRLVRKFAHFEPDAMATVQYVTIEPDLSTFTLASAGHLPPVMAVPGRDPVVVDCCPNPPIGAPHSTSHRDVVVELVPGATVASYTDGLVERRDESIDHGLERLRAALQAGPVEYACTAVMAELVGRDELHDDTALFVFRRTP
jgi:sigma-B regulation protein RsbU (phosphoserine phosphatase)